MDSEIETRLLPLAENRGARGWAMYLHLSLLAGLFVVPQILSQLIVVNGINFWSGWACGTALQTGAGLIGPIVIWRVKKDKYPELVAHGKVAVNWVLSYSIYVMVGELLFFFTPISPFLFPVLIALGLACIAFPIKAAIKANEGVLWQYPLAIRFL